MPTAEHVKSCEICGKTIQGNSFKWKGLAVMLCVIAGISIFVLGGYGEALPQDELFVYSDPSAPINDLGDVAYRDVIHTAPLLPPPEGTAPTDSTSLDVWRVLDEISGFVNEYYDRFSDSVLFLSKNGYLFDFPAWNYIFIDDLAGFSHIGEEYLVDGIMFFYMRPSDLARFRNVNVSERDSLVIFTGLEVREGFAITARGEQGGTVSREDLQSILRDYSWDHGEIRKVYTHSSEFETVISMLAGHTNNYSGFDIRYMYRDDRFICIVASPVDEPLNINMFILEYLEGAIFMRLSHLETFNDHRRALNNALPNFNQNLLPTYDLRQESRFLVDDFDDIIYDMLDAEILTEADLPVTFASGTAEFVYLEFASGMRFVGALESDVWQMYSVDNYAMARAVLYTLSRRPPLFIVRQS